MDAEKLPEPEILGLGAKEIVIDVDKRLGEAAVRATEGKYILDDAGEPLPCLDLLEWGRWMEDNSDRMRVLLDELPNDVRVSTVFLGLDHGFGGPTLLFETMVFRGEQWRYGTRAEALAGHAAAVELIRQAHALLEKT